MKKPHVYRSERTQHLHHHECLPARSCLRVLPLHFVEMKLKNCLLFSSLYYVGNNNLYTEYKRKT
jgi:hypothetical protein